MSHARLSASSSHRWMECSASVHYCEQLELDGLLPPQNTTFSDEGTRAHELAAACLEAGENYHAMGGDAEMGAFVQIYLDYANELINRSHIHAVECELLLGDYIDGGYGTADLVCVDNDGVLHVADLKYGVGVLVSAGTIAAPNTQLALYALGALDAYSWADEIEEVRLHVVQPRRDHISTLTLSLEQLLAFGESVKVAAVAVDEAPRFVPGDHCQFCPGRSVCRTRIEGTLALFKDISEIPMDDKELAEALLKVPAVKKVCNDLENYAEDLAKMGRVLPGFKLVQSRANRKWKPEAAEVVQQLVGDKGFEKKLLGIPAIEKLLGSQKVLLASVVEKPVGSPVLAPMDDPRQSIEVETFKPA